MNWKRFLIITCAAASVIIPIASGLIYGFDWGIYTYLGLALVAGIAIGIDQLVIRKRK